MPVDDRHLIETAPTADSFEQRPRREKPMRQGLIILARRDHSTVNVTIA